MANYEATTRSNYFRVKDAPAFEAWCRSLGLEFWTEAREEAPDDAFYAITADTGDCCGWPSCRIDNDEDIDFPEDLAGHLDPRDVAIVFEVGHEKLRYITGVAIAVHPDGRTVAVSLNDIYARARKAFGRKLTITEGSY
jgi:hypothetical protein